MSESTKGKVWYWRPGGIPVEATGKKIPEGVTYYCHEHDTEWIPIDQSRGRVVLDKPKR